MHCPCRPWCGIKVNGGAKGPNTVLRARNSMMPPKRTQPGHTPCNPGPVSMDLPTTRPVLGARQPAGVVASLTRGARPGRHRLVGSRTPRTLLFVYALWAIVLFEPQWWLASFGPAAIRQVPTPLFAILLLLVLDRVSDRTWYAPLVALTVFTAATAPFTLNVGFALTPVKQLVLYTVLAAGSLTCIRTPRQAVPVLLMLLLVQFLWWGLHGALPGRVIWHYANTNYDGFGPLMVIGMGSSAYVALALPRGRMRKLAILSFCICLVGLTSSFARGAILSAGLVLAFGWIRAPRKELATAGVVLALLLVVAVGLTIFADADRGDAQRSLFAEMSTVSRDIDEGTGEDRRELWGAAWDVFVANPVAGVGANNFGPYAAQYFQVGDLGGAYGENPARLYDRALHSTFFQILSEYGALGTMIFVWLMVDFWRRNARLRTRRYVSAWNTAVAGRLDLRYVALGLESAMVAYWATGFFYNQLFLPWLYSLLIANLLLYRITRPLIVPGTQRSAGRAR